MSGTTTTIYFFGTTGSDRITPAGISAGVTGGPFADPQPEFTATTDADEVVVGSDFEGNDEAGDLLDGGGGNDSLYGVAGDDTLIGDRKSVV